MPPSFARRRSSPARHPELRFLLCGDGTTRENEALVGSIAACGLLDRFLLLGRRHDVPRVMSAIDVGTLSSSYGEAFPLAIARGDGERGAVRRDGFGDCADLVGDTGRVVPPATPRPWRARGTRSSRSAGTAAAGSGSPPASGSRPASASRTSRASTWGSTAGRWSAPGPERRRHAPGRRRGSARPCPPRKRTPGSRALPAGPSRSSSRAWAAAARSGSRASSRVSGRAPATTSPSSRSAPRRSTRTRSTRPSAACRSTSSATRAPWPRARSRRRGGCSCCAARSCACTRTSS